MGYIFGASCQVLKIKIWIHRQAEVVFVFVCRRVVKLGRLLPLDDTHPSKQNWLRETLCAHEAHGTLVSPLFTAIS